MTGIFNFIAPINIINAENSAVHYNESLYTYVGNNPFNFVDPLGLDSVPTKTLTPVAVTTTVPWKSPLGFPLIYLSSRQYSLKPYGVLGSEPGSSIASKWLSKKTSLHRAGY